MRRIGLVVAVCLLGAATLSADFSYTQTTRVTGGTLLNMTRFMPGSGQLKEPQTHTIAVKGGKMVTYNNDSATIIDADAETMTQIDFKKKQYAVITFAEMKQAMLAMRAQLAQAQAQLAQAQQQAPQVNPLDAMKVSVNETGQSKVISGLNAKQFILTMEIGGAPAGAPPNTPSNTTTMDTWLAPTLPGYEEVTAFGVKMASKMSELATPGMNPMAMFREDVAKSVNTMATEMSKMNGIPVHQTMTMKGMQPSGPSVGDAAKGAAVDAAGQAAVGAALGRTRLGGLGGALGGFGRKKEEKPAEQAQPATLQPVVLMEQVTELTSLSSTVDASKFAVPAGFKQVEHDMKKLAKQ
jgi:hypothetical protein